MYIYIAINRIMNTVNRKFHRDTNAGPIDKVLTESILQCVLSTFGGVYGAGINIVI